MTGNTTLVGTTRGLNIYATLSGALGGFFTLLTVGNLDTMTPLGLIVYGGNAVMWFWFAIRVPLTGVFAQRDAIVVRNRFHTYSIPWDRVTDVGVGPSPRARSHQRLYIEADVRRHYVESAAFGPWAFGRGITWMREAEVYAAADRVQAAVAAHQSHAAL